MAGKVQEDLWVTLVRAYTLLEFDRSRFAMENQPASTKTIHCRRDAKGLKESLL